MASRNELIELYDSLSVLYNSLPAETDPEWELAVKSALHGDELLAEEATSYGKQQRVRNHGYRRNYVKRYGNGERITDFTKIAVAEPREVDKLYLPTDAQLPVAPESGEVLPAMVSEDDVDWAIALLAEFPAEPRADKPGDGREVLLDPDRVRKARNNTNRGIISETTVLFVSDTHLGYENRAKTGRGNRVPWIDEISSQETFTQILQIAVDEDADAIIHTGDLLDHEVDQDTLESVGTYFSLLSSLEIPIYCIIGSHDHDSADPRHPNSVDGIAWLKQQRDEGHLTELTTTPTPVSGGPVEAYGISAGNVGIDDVGKYHSREWGPSDVAFGASSQGPNVLCLHDGVTPYRGSDADVDLHRLLTQSRVSFDCILVGDEHRPKNQDFDAGYAFETANGTPVIYTGPAIRISEAYRDAEPFVTELSISGENVTWTRHSV